MKYVAVFIFSILVTSNALAIDNYHEAKGLFFSCDKVIKAHARIRFDAGEKKPKGPSHTWRFLGYIEGYVTAINYEKMGKKDWFKGMNIKKISNWVASYCRSNPSKDLDDALNEYTK